MSDLQELVIGSTRIVALRDGELSLPKEILLTSMMIHRLKYQTRIIN